MDNELLVKSVRELCKNNNISPSQLENDLNFGAGLISRWTKSSPSVDKIVDIANYFHVSLDEVVGYNQSINDEFLNLLISSTDNKSVLWSKHTTDSVNVKNYSDPYFEISLDLFSKAEYEEYIDNNKSIMYFTSFSTGYICIYARYQKFMITQPDELKLFIQADDESDLVPQNYETNELISLWVKILSKLDINAPDEIRAEDLKNSFINQFKQKQKPNKKVIFVNNPQNLKMNREKENTTDNKTEE